MASAFALVTRLRGDVSHQSLQPTRISRIPVEFPTPGRSTHVELSVVTYSASALRPKTYPLYETVNTVARYPFPEFPTPGDPAVDAAKTSCETYLQSQSRGVSLKRPIFVGIFRPNENLKIAPQAPLLTFAFHTRKRFLLRLNSLSIGSSSIDRFPSSQSTFHR